MLEKASMGSNLGIKTPKSQTPKRNQSPQNKKRGKEEMSVADIHIKTNTNSPIRPQAYDMTGYTKGILDEDDQIDELPNDLSSKQQNKIQNGQNSNPIPRLKSNSSPK